MTGTSSYKHSIKAFEFFAYLLFLEMYIFFSTRCVNKQHMKTTMCLNVRKYVTIQHIKSGEQTKSSDHTSF